MAHALQEQAYRRGSTDNLAVLAVDLQALRQEHGEDPPDPPQPSMEPAPAELDFGGVRVPWGVLPAPQRGTDAAVGHSIGVSPHGVCSIFDALAWGLT